MADDYDALETTTLEKYAERTLQLYAFSDVFWAGRLSVNGKPPPRRPMTWRQRWRWLRARLDDLTPRLHFGACDHSECY